MQHSNVYSPGWGAPVRLGLGQRRTYDALRERAHRAPHPSRGWFTVTVRELDPDANPGSIWRELRRLAALGSILIQSIRGCRGMTRITFGVPRWRTRPIRRGQTARMMGPNVSRETVQLAAWEPPPPEPSARKPLPAARRHPRLTPNPDGSRPTFGDMIRRQGVDPDSFVGRKLRGER